MMTLFMTLLVRDEEDIIEEKAICILGLEFTRSDPGFEIRSNVASGWISLFFAASPESNIGWIL
jgi:hypothetical protein